MLSIDSFHSTFMKKPLREATENKKEASRAYMWDGMGSDAGWIALYFLLPTGIGESVSFCQCRSQLICRRLAGMVRWIHWMWPVDAFEDSDLCAILSQWVCLCSKAETDWRSLVAWWTFWVWTFWVCYHLPLTEEVEDTGGEGHMDVERVEIEEYWNRERRG